MQSSSQEEEECLEKQGHRGRKMRRGREREEQYKEDKDSETDSDPE